MPGILDPNARELSESEALQAAADFFRDFDLRVMNQRIVERHAADSAKAAQAAPRLTTSETAGEGSAQ